MDSHFFSSAWRHRKHSSLSAWSFLLFLRLIIPRHSRPPYRDAWHLHRRRLLYLFTCGGQFSDSLCFATLQAMAQWSFNAQVSDTLQQVLPLRRPLLTNLRSMLELASPLMKIGFFPSLSSVTSSTENSSKCFRFLLRFLAAWFHFPGVEVTCNHHWTLFDEFTHIICFSRSFLAACTGSIVLFACRYRSSSLIPLLLGRRYDGSQVPSSLLDRLRPLWSFHLNELPLELFPVFECWWLHLRRVPCWSSGQFLWLCPNYPCLG